MLTFKIPWTQINISSKWLFRIPSVTQAKTLAKTLVLTIRILKPPPAPSSNWCRDAISSSIMMFTNNNKNNSICRPKMINQDPCKEACKWRAGRSAAATPASNNSSSNRWWPSRRNWIRLCRLPMPSRTIMEVDQLWCWLRTRRSRRVTIQPANLLRLMLSRHRHIRSFKSSLRQSRAKISKSLQVMATLIRFQTRTRRASNKIVMDSTMLQMLTRRLWAASRRCTWTTATSPNNTTMGSCRILSPEILVMLAYMGNSRRATILCFRIIKTARMDPTMAWSSHRGCSSSWPSKTRKWRPNRI